MSVSHNKRCWAINPTDTWHGLEFFSLRCGPHRWTFMYGRSSFFEDCIGNFQEQIAKIFLLFLVDGWYLLMLLRARKTWWGFLLQGVHEWFRRCFPCISRVEWCFSMFFVGTGLSRDRIHFLKDMMMSFQRHTENTELQTVSRNTGNSEWWDKQSPEQFIHVYCQKKNLPTRSHPELCFSMTRSGSGEKKHVTNEMNVEKKTWKDRYFQSMSKSSVPLVTPYNSSGLLSTAILSNNQQCLFVNNDSVKESHNPCPTLPSEP